MKKPDDVRQDSSSLRDKIIGLGEQSFRKSYFPQLQTQLNRLEQFRSLLNHSKDGILLVDCETASILDANQAASEMVALETTLLTTPFHELFPPQQQTAIRGLLDGQGADADTVQIVEIQKAGADGRTRVLEFTINRTVLHTHQFLVVLARDITHLKAQEARLLASLKEKEALLKEIHHRVKNNLQVISSLLHLQAMNCQDPHTQDVLRESQARVMSMALVHERLYHSSDLAGIDFVEVFPSMTRELLRSYGRSDIRLSTDIEPVHLSIDAAIPLGLIASELVSNALKHAFPNTRSGEITVSLHAVNDGNVRLVVSDNGIGLPPDVNIRSMRSMGMTLIHNLVEQLEGSISLERDRHTRFIVTFPLSGRMQR
jgi:two-component system, sensor histidine kinase PdtaS